MPDASPTLQNVIYLLLRRMRSPLIVLICAYAVSILGLVLIPGMDDQGNPWRMDFFHAVYFVSFMGTTIGFGEIPYPFTDAQRMWTICIIYITVIAWLYAIGAMFAVLQDRAFRQVMSRARFMRAVRRLSTPFYVVCGYGDTGSLLVRALADRGIQAVVIDVDQQRVDALKIEGLPVYVPGLCADAADPAALVAGGLNHPQCAGVVSLTNSDHANLSIAIASKQLAPDVLVISRAETHDAEDNMASFGTDHIINPFDTFAARFAMAIHSPSMYLIYEWMTHPSDVPLAEIVAPPRGEWVLCGYGRFGKAVHGILSKENIHAVIVEANPELTGVPPGAVIGRGTEAPTLLEASIEDADGIIAGTDNDANNLSIIMTAKQLNPRLFTVARQNDRRNDRVFSSAGLDMIMQRGDIIARKIMALLITPLLADFLRLLRERDDEWANLLVSRLSGVLADYAPDIWAIEITDESAPALAWMLRDGGEVLLRHLLRDPRHREDALMCVPLLLKRASEEILLPEEGTLLQPGDQIMFAGRYEADAHMQWTARNFNALEYVRTGIESPSGFLWRWLAGKRTVPGPQA